MKNSPLNELGDLGQSFWLDYIQRDLIVNGGLKKLIENDGLRGMTSNPALFEKAIVQSHVYDIDIRSMTAQKADEKAIYEALSRADVQSAADVFTFVYTETKGEDGYVSLEVNPHLAHDTEGTINEARRLWISLDRPNVLIKVPATIEGIPAITQLVTEGINVNVTLLFGLRQYRLVAEAYIAGIEARIAHGKSVEHVASVASFFISRIDSLVDPLLEKIVRQSATDASVAKKMIGEVGVASAKMAYQVYKEMFCSDRFARLGTHGARAQRVLWASTGTKNPLYRDVKYIEALIGPDTVTTIPMKTLDAFREHGVAKALLDHNVPSAKRTMAQLHALGIDMDAVSQQLENEGVEKFIKPFDLMLASIKNIPVEH